MNETNEKNVVKISLSTFFLILATIAIVVMAVYIFIEKTSHNNEIEGLETKISAKQNEIDGLQGKIDSISNTINSGKTANSENDTNNSEELKDTTNNIATSNNKEEKQNKTVIYEFQSADRAAAQGYPRILKVFELTENELEFEYNSGHNFDTSTIDRKIIGTARANAEQLYEFDETIDNHQYKLIFEFNESKDTVTVFEYDNGNEMGYINLFR